MYQKGYQLQTGNGASNIEVGQRRMEFQQPQVPKPEDQPNSIAAAKSTVSQIVQIVKLVFRTVSDCVYWTTLVEPFCG